MAKDNSPDLETGGAQKKAEKQRLLLLVLLLLLAAVGYLYFFTGLIKSREEVAKPAVPLAAQVKKPLPPRLDEKGEGGAPVKESAAKPTEMKEPKAGTEPVVAKSVLPQTGVAKSPGEVTKKDGGAVKSEAKKPAASPKAEQPVKTVETKSQASAPKKHEELAATKTIAPKSQPSQQGKAEKPVDKTVAVKKVEKKPVTKAEPTQVAGNKAETKTKSATKPMPATAGKGQFVLSLGDFVPGQALVFLEKKLVNLGLAPLGKTKLQKPEPMNRLFVGEFADYDQAAAGLAKLKKLTDDAFYLENNGKYTLYAGSYYGKALVDKEKTRLTGKGVKIEVQKVEVPVAMVHLTVGRFSNRDEAEKAVARLKKQGLSARVVSW